MTHKVFPLECLLPSTAIGIIATIAAPWMELRGTYAAWRIVEWHAFWRGDRAFLLGDVVATNYQLPIEYATVAMQNTLRDLFALGSILGVWHVVVLIALLVAGARLRLRAGASRTRVALEIIALIAVNAIVLALLTMLLALPSSLTQKVDFRTSVDIHTDSLIWSSINVLLLAPALSVIAVVGQLIALAAFLKGTRTAKRG